MGSLHARGLEPGAGRRRAATVGTYVPTACCCLLGRYPTYLLLVRSYEYGKSELVRQRRGPPAGAVTCQRTKLLLSNVMCNAGLWLSISYHETLSRRYMVRGSTSRSPYAYFFFFTPPGR